MARKDHVPPLKPIQRPVRPTTQLQRQHLEQQGKDLNHAQRSTESIRAFLMQGHHPQPSNNAQPVQPLHEDQAPLDMQVDDDDEHTPHPFYPEQEPDPIIQAMAEARYQDLRLQNKTRWATQVAQMVPYFLRCRLWTSNWGNPKLRHHDYRSSCGCSMGRVYVRAVDLVDLDGK